MKILIADDDPVYREVVGTLLEKWDFEVVTVSDGQQALEVLNGSDPPQLIILDWEMPNMDGYEVAKTIQQSALWDKTYTLMITGDKRRPDLQQVLLYADDYLIKPFDALDLKIHIRNAIQIINLKEEIRQMKQPNNTRVA
ncbi:MAG: response regulator [Phycisphaerae bacterium]|nr:response regulator [Phycisphaerae bacterium]